MIELQIGTFSVIISARFYTGIITVQERLANLNISKREPILLIREQESLLEIQEYKVNLKVETSWF